MSIQLALRFDEAPITCETRAALSKALLERYPLWRYPDFQRLIQYQAPSDQQKLREEMVKLRQQGWTEKRIAQLLRCSRKTVAKWLRRARQAESQPDDRQPWLLDLSRAPHRTSRKVFFGAIHAVLELQKKYGYAGAFRIKRYFEKDYGIYLGETAIRKIMAPEPPCPSGSATPRRRR